MKSSNTALINFLYTTQSAVMADLYTITLNGGGVLRWTSADVPVTYNGNTFALGPLCSNGGMQSKVGTAASSIDITFASSASFTIGGVPFIDWVIAGGFDGAVIRIDRAVAPDWPTMLSAPTGGWQYFYGRYDGAKELGQTQVVVTASDWRVLLSRNFPQDCYQTSCRNILGDAKCGYNLAANVVAGIAVTSVASSAAFAAASSLGARTFTFGSIAFTTGANAGISRTIKAYDNAGNFTLTSPFPAAPAVGDLFNATPGCDLSTDNCNTYNGANWPLRFRGEPYIPAPTTGMPT